MLVEITKLVAPFVPFLAESLWKHLVINGFNQAGQLRVPESVHLCDYPSAIQERLDQPLSQSMNVLREIASLGRAARAEAKLKVRQPLQRVEVILAEPSQTAWLQSHAKLLQEELNVREIEYTSDAREYVTYQVTPNFKRLGPKLGPLLPKVKQALSQADGSSLLNQIQSAGKITLTIDGAPVVLDNEDVQVRLQAKSGWAAAQGKGCVVVLNTEVTPELEREGWAKDLIRMIQNQRKTVGCRFTDRIAVRIGTDSKDLEKAIEENRETIMSETLAVELSVKQRDLPNATFIEIGTFEVQLVVENQTNDAVKQGGK